LPAFVQRLEAQVDGEGCRPLLVEDEHVSLKDSPLLLCVAEEGRDMGSERFFLPRAMHVSNGRQWGVGPTDAASPPPMRLRRAPQLAATWHLHLFLQHLHLFCGYAHLARSRAGGVVVPLARWHRRSQRCAAAGRRVHNWLRTTAKAGCSNAPRQTSELGTLHGRGGPSSLVHCRHFHRRSFNQRLPGTVVKPALTKKKTHSALIRRCFFNAVCLPQFPLLEVSLLLPFLEVSPPSFGEEGRSRRRKGRGDFKKERRSEGKDF
jgi:hypothetical protein